ncbi:hypothetical protein S40285_06204 [Stachybotrys chlorohalonatus IBT 40285]|uniref:A-kinase anchor protein 7-like phosphoesterase domain-containing protein n=1 Tax=Stachybotrys chlorohalonatus (strain IBT 40285) TaxID=1283841 RepID=A0A084QCD8_STAC4|nr:hypothetical protein S40285_06204 [Stachybotrys chlorohalonata IBT 40285]
MPPRAMPTHFLCIPLAGPQLGRSLASFKADVVTRSGIPADAVRPLGTLHLTLGVMALREDTLAQAVDVLKGLSLTDALANARAAANISSSGRPSISLKGLHSMHPPARTSVLYAPPTDPEGVLRPFCEQLRRPFLESGLMADEGRPLLLHATVVNTIYVGRGRGGRRRERMTLDARELLRRHEEYVWLEGMPLEKLTLCRMGAKRIEGSNGDEAYEVVAEVGF